MDGGILGKIPSVFAMQFGGISPFLGFRRFYFDIDAENRIHLALFSAVTRSEDEDETVIRLSMAGIRPRSARFSSQNCAQKAI